MLPNSLGRWNDYLLITTYNHTKNVELQSMVVREILLRSALRKLENI